MFANYDALVSLVTIDRRASDEEKEAVLSMLRGDARKMPRLESAAVVSFQDAAKILGYTSKSGVYEAVRNGVLDGYYGGAAGDRAIGVTTESIKRALRSPRCTRRKQTCKGRRK